MDFSGIRDEEESGVLENRPGCLRSLLSIFLFLLIPLLAIVAALPTLLSTDSGRIWCTEKINQAITPSQFSCESWSLSWVTPPHLKQVLFNDPVHGLNLKTERVTCNKGLLGLLPIGSLNFGTLTVEHPDLTVTPQPEAIEKTQETTPKEKSKPGGFFLPILDIAGEIKVQNGQARLIGRSPVPFVAEKISGHVAITSFKEPVALALQSVISGGSIELSGKIQSLYDLSHNRESDEPQTLTLTCVAMPLTAMRPLLHQLTGEPWIESGVAEGTVRATFHGKTRGSLTCGLMLNRIALQPADQPRTPPGDLTDLNYDRQTVNIKRFELVAPWVRADAQGLLQAGKPSDRLTGAVQVKVTLHLAPLTRDFASLLGLSKEFKVTRGDLLADLQLNGSAEAMRIEAAVKTQKLVMTVAGKPLALMPEPAMQLKATFPYGALPIVEKLHLTTPFAEVQGSGRFDAAKLSGRLDLTRFSRDFSRVLKNCPPMVGVVNLDLSTRKTQHAVAIDATLRIADLAAELKPSQLMVIPQGAIKLTGNIPFKNDLPEQELRDTTFEMSLGKGKLSGGWKRLALAREQQPLELRGFTLSGNLDMASFRRVMGGFMTPSLQKRLQTWQGNLIANVTAEVAGGALKAYMNAAGQQLAASLDQGVWRIPDVRMEGALTRESPTANTAINLTAQGNGTYVRDGTPVYREPNLRVAADLSVAANNHAITASKFSLSCALFDLETQGSLKELSTRNFLSAQGTLALDATALTQLLHAQGIDEISMTGRQPRPFRLTTPLAGGLPTVLAEADITAGAQLDSLKGFGLTAESAPADFRLSKGLLHIAYEPKISSGNLRLRPSVDLARSTGAITFPAKTRLLEKVPITQEMLDTLLVNMNPLFKGSQVLSGTITLDLRSFRIVRNTPPEKGIAIDMDLALDRFSMTMGPQLREFLAMLKINESTYRVEHLPVHVLIREGRVHVDPVTMVIEKQPMTFSGWVAFNGAIKYQIAIPITERLAGGVAGRLLQNKTITIPITGTVTDPHVDLAVLQRALGGLVKQAIGEDALKKVGTFLEQLQQELRK